MRHSTFVVRTYYDVVLLIVLVAIANSVHWQRMEPYSSYNMLVLLVVQGSLQCSATVQCIASAY